MFINNQFILLSCSIAIAAAIVLFYLVLSIRRSKREMAEIGEQLTSALSQLADERRQTSTILASMAEGLLAVDADKKLILVNPMVERMFSVVGSAVLGKTVREAIRNNEIADLIDEVKLKQTFIEKEIEIIIPLEASFIAHAGPILNETGMLSGVVAVLFNITEIKRLERYRSEFVANVSHELKTPLTAIINCAETLERGVIEDKEQQLEFIVKIEKHAQNLNSLIEDILELSRLESKKDLGLFAKMDLAEIAEQAIDMISEKAKGKKIVLIRNLKMGEYNILGSREHVYRAIVNLLDNAINYSNPQGSIWISLIKEQNNIKLSVLDNGIGISVEHLPRIFERFYRVDRARSRNLGGTGLGLAIVKHVMSLRQGGVSVESQEGKGSKFTLSFPF